LSRQHLFFSSSFSKVLLPSLCAVSLWAVATPARAQSTCSPLAVSAVTASANDGNVPANVLDGNTDTRWSCDGMGCWLRADLGADKQVGAVDVTWFKGNERNSNYVLALSRDGSSWTTVASGLSARTAAAQRLSFTAATARYVKLTVNGNTTNNWASVGELGVLQCGTVTTPPPPPPPPPPPTGSSTDAFGVTMLYPSKAGGQAWALSSNPTSDARFDPQDTITKNADGSWKIKSTQVRLSAFTSSGYSSSRVTTDRNTLASRGYMQDANDWKNVEMTGFVKLNAVSDVSDNFDWYARGGRHTDSLACEGSSYKGGLHYDGRTRWQKETWHVSYEQAAYKPATTALKGRWVGFKSVLRNTTVSGKAAVRMELYLNDNADKVTWKKIYDMVDAGDWGGDASHCGASSANNAMPITWGGPIAVFRWDNASDVDFKWLSVREIQP
jgi:hypothetical protein